MAGEGTITVADGRTVGMLRTHVNPSGDAKNMAIVVSEDDGFSWSQPRFTNIWGYPAEFATLPDGRISYWGSTDPTLWTGSNPNQPTGYTTLQRTGSNPAFGGQSTFLTNTGKGEA